jgi:hypothetical protein
MPKSEDLIFKASESPVEPEFKLSKIDQLEAEHQRNLRIERQYVINQKNVRPTL